MTPLRFLDTNILLYSISVDPAEAKKRERPVALLEERDNVLSVQVLQEFYVQATCVNRLGALPHGLAVGFIESWTRFAIQDLTVRVLRMALEIRERYGFSYWDSAIVAAAQESGCHELFSEDLRHGQIVDRLLLVDPFRI